jgi:hypothetical protein
MADSLAKPKWFNLAKKQSTNHMAIRVWFIAKAALVDRNQGLASDRRPEAVTKALGTHL